MPSNTLHMTTGRTLCHWWLLGNWLVLPLPLFMKWVNARIGECFHRLHLFVMASNLRQSRSVTPIFASREAMLCVYLFHLDVSVSAGWMLCIPGQFLNIFWYLLLALIAVLNLYGFLFFMNTIEDILKNVHIALFHTVTMNGYWRVKALKQMQNTITCIMMYILVCFSHKAIVHTSHGLLLWSFFLSLKAWVSI